METLEREAAPPTGTSLEILAPYLPYGIELIHLPSGKLVPLLALDADPEYGVTYHRSFYRRLPSQFLPVLRPFSALCEPLEDGTVPAVEVAKIVYSDANQGLQGFGYKVNWASAKVRADFNENGCWLNLEYLGGATPGPSLRFSNRGSWWQVSSTTASSVGNPLAIADHLRRHHFAVGLEPHQYIAKAGGALSIQEGTGRPD